MRLAYREDGEADHLVNPTTALRLLGVSNHETIWDDATDTHSVLGWSDSQVVVAFRYCLTLQYCRRQG